MAGKGPWWLLEMSINRNLRKTQGPKQALLTPSSDTRLHIWCRLCVFHLNVTENTEKPLVAFRHLLSCWQE